MLITPPVGINVYLVEGVAEGVRTPTIFKGIRPFLVAIIVGAALLMIFPQIATFLPLKNPLRQPARDFLPAVCAFARLPSRAVLLDTWGGIRYIVTSERSLATT